MFVIQEVIYVDNLNSVLLILLIHNLPLFRQVVFEALVLDVVGGKVSVEAVLTVIVVVYFVLQVTALR